MVVMNLHKELINNFSHLWILQPTLQYWPSSPFNVHLHHHSICCCELQALLDEMCDVDSTLEYYALSCCYIHHHQQHSCSRITWASASIGECQTSPSPSVPYHCQVHSSCSPHFLLLQESQATDCGL